MDLHECVERRAATVEAHATIDELPTRHCDGRRVAEGEREGTRQADDRRIIAPGQRYGYRGPTRGHRDIPSPLECLVQAAEDRTTKAEIPRTAERVHQHRDVLRRPRRGDPADEEG